MPIYEYACTACGHGLEVMQKISDAPLVRCPECGQDALTKQISKVAFRLKGTGWYETDFKNKKKADAKDDKSKADSKSSTKPDAKSDAGGKSDSSSSSSSSKSSDKSSSASGD
ncbi:MAG: FmdB family zinc ribbon protein [Gammaproteobacteria bacterium]